MISVDCSRPSKLYRYGEYRWNIKSLLAGEFRLVPASVYGEVKDDAARQDNELVREQRHPGKNVTVTDHATGKHIPIIGDITYCDEIGTDYYTLCFSSTWDSLLFDEFKGSDSCLVIHKPEEFCERVHFCAEKLLKDWVGIDAAVSYFFDSKLGPAFSKPWKYLPQKEWRFAWHPPIQMMKLPVAFLQIGSIERIAEILTCPESNKVNG